MDALKGLKTGVAASCYSVMAFINAVDSGVLTTEEVPIKEASF